jgi:hypothetical protein
LPELPATLLALTVLGPSTPIDATATTASATRRQTFVVRFSLWTARRDGLNVLAKRPFSAPPLMRHGVGIVTDSFNHFSAMHLYLID